MRAAHGDGSGKRDEQRRRRQAAHRESVATHRRPRNLKSRKTITPLRRRHQSGTRPRPLAQGTLTRKCQTASRVRCRTPASRLARPVPQVITATRNDRASKPGPPGLTPVSGGLSFDCDQPRSGIGLAADPGTLFTWRGRASSLARGVRTRAVGGRFARAAAAATNAPHPRHLRRVLHRFRHCHQCFHWATEKRALSRVDSCTQAVFGG